MIFWNNDGPSGLLQDHMGIWIWVNINYVLMMLGADTVDYKATARCHHDDPAKTGNKRIAWVLIDWLIDFMWHIKHFLMNADRCTGSSWACRWRRPVVAQVDAGTRHGDGVRAWRRRERNTWSSGASPTGDTWSRPQQDHVLCWGGLRCSHARPDIWRSLSWCVARRMEVKFLKIFFWSQSFFPYIMSKGHRLCDQESVCLVS